MPEYDREMNNHAIMTTGWTQKWHNVLYANNLIKYWPIFIFFTVRIRRKFVVILSLKTPYLISVSCHISYVSLHYLVKCQTSHSSWRRHWSIAWSWSTLIKPDLWPPNNTDLNPADYVVWGPSTDGLSTSTIYDNQPVEALRVANCCSILVNRAIAMVSGVAGLSASFNSKADT